jgi:hypothetical protein
MATQDKVDPPKVEKVESSALVTARELYNLANRVHVLERKTGSGTADLDASHASIQKLRVVLAEQDPEVKKELDDEKKAADEAAAEAKRLDEAAIAAKKSAAKGPAPIPVHETSLHDK